MWHVTATIVALGADHKGVTEIKVSHRGDTDVPRAPGSDKEIASSGAPTCPREP